MPFPVLLEETKSTPFTTYQIYSNPECIPLQPAACAEHVLPHISETDMEILEVLSLPLDLENNNDMKKK